MVVVVNFSSYFDRHEPSLDHEKPGKSPTAMIHLVFLVLSISYSKSRHVTLSHYSVFLLASSWLSPFLKEHDKKLSNVNPNQLSDIYFMFGILFIVWYTV
ncbi:hypothetical protein HN011_010631 [Eciton burchellii]|nr:hypothetical protein HN011_010631 [Eciton burchellii]